LTLFEVPPQITERQWQASLLDGFKALGYWTNHNQPTRAGDRWVTSGSPGFPDILATGPRGLVVVEVKGFKTSVRAEQILCLEAFAEGGAHAWILRPNSVDWNTVVDWMRDPETSPRRFGWDAKQLAGAKVAQLAARGTIRRPAR
jgi:Holliday junction resolvase